MRRLAVLASIMLLAAPLGAQAADPPVPLPEPGLSYRVVGVAADDVLNVRDQPGTAAAIVATLPHNATGIFITGVREPVGPGMWWEVIQPGVERGVGWVNARFLAAEAVEPETDFALMCVGTEPFWSLAVGGGEADFELLGEEPVTWTASPWRDAAGFLPGYRFAVRLHSASPPGTGWAAISRAMDFCTDQMSDRLYPYDTVVIAPDERVFAGCCARAP